MYAVLFWIGIWCNSFYWCSVACIGVSSGFYAQVFGIGFSLVFVRSTHKFCIKSNQCWYPGMSLLTVYDTMLPIVFLYSLFFSSSMQWWQARHCSALSSHTPSMMMKQSWKSWKKVKCSLRIILVTALTRDVDLPHTLYSHSLPLSCSFHLHIDVAQLKISVHQGSAVLDAQPLPFRFKPFCWRFHMQMSVSSTQKSASSPFSFILPHHGSLFQMLCKSVDQLLEAF